jgi:hypothetical protein
MCACPQQRAVADKRTRRAEVALHDHEESRVRKQEGLELEFQPKVASATRRIDSVEALEDSDSMLIQLHAPERLQIRR